MNQKEIILNLDQKNLVSSLVEFYHSDIKKDIDKHFLLSGQAGTGKTTSIRYFLSSLSKIASSKDEVIKIAITTPTNKSLRVIKEAISGDTFEGLTLTFKTIYSLLNLRLEPSGAIKELMDRSDGKNDAASNEVIIIDEASMLPKLVMTHLDRKTAFTGTKIVMLGDNEQLPPVNEDESIIWRMFEPSFTLSKVERHDSSILSFVQHVRANPKPRMESTGDQVHIMDDESFEEKIYSLAVNGDFHKGNAKVIAWRNVTVDTYNEFIRESYELTRSDDPYTIGDRIVLTAPVNSDDRLGYTIANTDDEGVVMNVTISRHHKYPQYKVWLLDVKLDVGDDVLLRVIHDSSEWDLKDALDDLAKAKQWGKFWELKDSFHSLKHAYAITSHRSQGSTFEHVFVDASDIMENRDIGTRTKCLYVATSRASEQLYILP